MTSKEKEAFEKWWAYNGNYGSPYAIWHAALEWAANGQEPEAWLGVDVTNNNKPFVTMGAWASSMPDAKPLYLHPAPTPESWSSYVERIAGLEKELRECRNELENCCYRDRVAKEEIVDWQKEAQKARFDLAECQAREAKLREALSEIDDHAPWGGDNVDDYIRWMRDVAKQALALPQDDTALKEAIKQAKREALIEAAESLQVDQWTSVSAELRRMAEEMK